MQRQRAVPTASAIVPLLATLLAGCATSPAAPQLAPRVAEQPAPAPPALGRAGPVARAVPVGAGLAGLGDAASIADSEDEEVRFEDTVMAISRAAKGYYLSFGAPYPKQVLSVWVPFVTYERLGRRWGVGSVVRVSGSVRQTRGGPQLDLGSVKRFELVPVDEAILERRTLQGRKERRLFSSALRQRLDRATSADLDWLDRLGNELEAAARAAPAGAPASGGRYQDLGEFFSAFQLARNEPDEAYERRAALLADWRDRHPLSSVPVLLAASLHLDLAWRVRGEDTIDHVSPWARDRFVQELAAARDLLTQRQELPTWPAYFELMLQVAFGQGWPRDEYFRLFEAATALEPDHVAFYLAVTYYLKPQWYGKKGQWERFAEEQRERRGGAEGDILYALVAWSLEPEYAHKMFSDSSISWEIVASGLKALIARTADPRYYRTVYAYLAWEAGDAVRLREALDAMGDDADMDVFANLDDVEKAGRFATKHGAPATR